MKTPKHNPAGWAIFTQMMDIAVAKITSYYDDLAIIDAVCLARHDPANRFYWIVDQQGTHWGTTTKQSINYMRSAITIFGYREVRDYYIYDQATGLQKTTMQIMNKDLLATEEKLAAGALKPANRYELPTLPRNLAPVMAEIRQRDMQLNRTQSGGRSNFEQAMLAWTTPAKFYVSNFGASWGPKIWPADNHPYFLHAALAGIRHTYRDAEFHIYQNGKLEQVTQFDLEANIRRELAAREPRPQPVKKRAARTAPFIPPLTPGRMQTATWLPA